MISLICDACLARFQVSDDNAGATVFCPKCGAKNGVPFPDGAAASSPAVAAATPTGGSPGEELLLRVRPAMFRARPFSFSGLLLLVLAGVGGGIYFLSSGRSGLGIACLAGSLLGIVPLVVWKIYNMGTSLEITNKRTVSYRGLFSKKSNEVRHNDVKNFQVDQTFLNRILGVGAVGISSSGQDEIEIHVKDLPNPYRIREIINQHRKM